jgi:hypothetical protein
LSKKKTNRVKPVFVKEKDSIFKMIPESVIYRFRASSWAGDSGEGGRRMWHRYWA